MVKGIKIKGFEKLVSNNNSTRNINVPQYITERFKKSNGSSVKSNSNFYMNTSNSYKTQINWK